jgi:hypothetical protein
MWKRVDQRIYDEWAKIFPEEHSCIADLKAVRMVNIDEGHLGRCKSAGQPSSRLACGPKSLNITTELLLMPKSASFLPGVSATPRFSPSLAGNVNR